MLILIALTGILGVLPDVPVRAESDPNFALVAAGDGTVKPLSAVLRTVKRKVPGQVLDVQLDKNSNPQVYRIRVRSEKGNVILVVVDAISGRILSTRGNR